jgi:hypothetical protein
MTLRSKTFIIGDKIIAGNSRGAIRGTVAKVDQENRTLIGVTRLGTKFSASFHVTRTDK